MRQSLRLASLLLATVALAAGFAACSGTPRSANATRPYPAAKGQGDVLDIQVIRRGTEIELTNTSARALGPGTLWLNRRFAKPLPGMPVGERMTLDLYDFLDEHGRAFRGGGFFAKEPPQKLVLAQYELAEPADAKVLGLLVVGQSD